MNDLELQPCGTQAAYFRHRRNGEVPCAACVRAHSDYNAAWKRSSRRHATGQRLLEHRITAVEQRLLESDLRDLIRLVALAFTTPPDKDQGRLAAEDAVSVGDRAPGEPRAGSRIQSGSRGGNPGANPGPGTAVLAAALGHGAP